MDALRVGQHALLVICADANEVAATYALLRERAVDLGAIEVVPAARTVLLDGLRDPAATQLALTAWAVDEVTAVAADQADRRMVELPTSYDGEDLDEVARQWQTTTAEVIRLHQVAEFTVAFCGFAPGFAYCTGLPEDLAVTRRAEPRASVPAGSVALAGEYTGVYPTSSPGGWQLIGTTSAVLWRPDTTEPALMTPGTRVRFVDA